MEYKIKKVNESTSVTVSERPTVDGVTFVDFYMHYDEPTVPEQVSVIFEVPIIDIWSIFSAENMYLRNFSPSWHKRTNSSRLASGAPLFQFISGQNRNRLTIALSDAANPIQIASGVIERTAYVQCVVSFFTQPVNKLTDYHAVIRIDRRDVRYEETLKASERWWADDCGYPSAYTPDIARRPLYSTWYSFHQDIDVDEIVHQCALAKEYGMDSVIVDDGWQIENAHGYVNCGDWIPVKSKVPDMKDFVRRVHDLGLKFTLWYHLPAFGVESKAHERFKDMLLDPSSGSWAAYDPRFPEVRKYMCDILAKAIKDWDLDGFKLDFIDSFRLHSETPSFDERWDTLSLEDGVDKLLDDITKALRAVKPDVMIEFRQFYFGPVIRKYGNMIRVGDCPNDSMRNHVAGTDLRFMLGKTPVHSDMLMWNVNDPVEAAARQVISTLYLVPQISVLLDKIPEDHRQMLKFYLKFWCDHRDTLLDGKFEAENPECGYSLVRSEGKDETVAVAWSLPVLDRIPDKKLYFVNASSAGRLFIRPDVDMGVKHVKIYSVTGEVICEKDETITAGICEYDVPVCGMLSIE